MPEPVITLSVFFVFILKPKIEEALFSAYMFRYSSPTQFLICEISAMQQQKLNSKKMMFGA